nr:unnamed protein product [Callosobruchus analis]
MLINKPPDSDPDFSLHPLHQDLQYFPFRPANRIAASWTAMEKVDENNGCLYVVPGSHLDGILYKHETSKHTLYDGVQGKEHLKKVHVPMEKGDTLFFHPLLLHGSGPNSTKGFRKAISCHYADTNCHFIDVRGTNQADLMTRIEEIAVKFAAPLNYVVGIEEQIKIVLLLNFGECYLSLIVYTMCSDTSVGALNGMKLGLYLSTNCDSNWFWFFHSRF